MSPVAVGSGAIVMAAGIWLGSPVWAAIAGGVVTGVLTSHAPARSGAAAGVLAWGGILIASWFAGNPAGLVAQRLGGVMNLPAWAPVLLTVALPALLGASAATLAASARGARRRA